MRRVAIHRPRLLPATIVAAALLLLLKTADLLWAAVAGASPAVPGSALLSQAQAAPGTAKSMGAALGASAPSPAGAAPVVGPPAPPVSEAERALLLDLRHRRLELDQRARDLDQRGAVLAAAEARLSARVAELGALQARLETLESARHSYDDANWIGLVHVYETMKPQQAAQIFDSLDMGVLLAVLDRMQPRRAAPVLAAMQPDRARLVTQMLAELRTRAVTPPIAAPRDSGTPPSWGQGEINGARQAHERPDRGRLQTMLRIIRNLLKQIDFHNVQEASDGSEALTKLRAGNFGLVISDWNMAPMTGLELLQNVRQDIHLRDLPFIMVTAESKSENVIAARQAGVSNYIVKPFNAETLREKIEMVLAHA